LSPENRLLPERIQWLAAVNPVDPVESGDRLVNLIGVPREIVLPLNGFRTSRAFSWCGALRAAPVCVSRNGLGRADERK
jgi:hypothetical protein